MLVIKEKRSGEDVLIIKTFLAKLYEHPHYTPDKDEQLLFQYLKRIEYDYAFRVQANDKARREVVGESIQHAA